VQIKQHDVLPAWPRAHQDMRPCIVVSGPLPQHAAKIVQQSILVVAASQVDGDRCMPSHADDHPWTHVREAGDFAWIQFMACKVDGP
jgi:hypothetical protein